MDVEKFSHDQSQETSTTTASESALIDDVQLQEPFNAQLQEDANTQLRGNPLPESDAPIALRRGRRTKGAYRTQDHHPETYAANTMIQYGPHLQGMYPLLSFCKRFSLAVHSL